MSILDRFGLVEDPEWRTGLTRVPPWLSRGMSQRFFVVLPLYFQVDGQFATYMHPFDNLEDAEARAKTLRNRMNPVFGVVAVSENGAHVAWRNTDQDTAMLTNPNGKDFGSW